MNGRIVFNTPFFNIEELPAEGSSNGLPYYRLNSPDSVICCVLTSTGDFLMVEQYRPNLQAHTLEFPAGEVDPGESPICAAKREIREEIGIDCRFIPLGHYFLMMNRANARNHLFLCLQDSEIGSFATEAGIETRRVSRAEFESLVRHGNYHQLAGLGILHLAWIHLGLNVLNDPPESVCRTFDKYAVSH